MTPITPLQEAETQELCKWISCINRVYFQGYCYGHAAGLEAGLCGGWEKQRDSL